MSLVLFPIVAAVDDDVRLKQSHPVAQALQRNCVRPAKGKTVSILSAHLQALLAQTNEIKYLCCAERRLVSITVSSLFSLPHQIPTP